MPSAFRLPSFPVSSLALVLGLLLPLGTGCQPAATDDDAGDDDASDPVIDSPTPEPGDDDDTEEGDDDMSLPDFGDDDASIPEPELEEGEWYDHNRETITAFAQENGGGSDPRELPAAVFDWENTSIFNEIGPAVFRHQVLNLQLRFDTLKVEDMIPLSAGPTWDAPATLEQFTTEDGTFTIRDLRDDIINDYASLWEEFEGLGCQSGCKSLEELQETDVYQDFTAKLIFLYEGLTRDPAIGPDFTHPWIALFLGGFTETEAAELALEVFNEHRTADIEEMELSSPDRGMAGQVTCRWLKGIRVIPEMTDLYDFMRRNAFDLWVVTSSAEVVVGGVVGLYGIPADHVIGIVLEKEHIPGQRNPKMIFELKDGVAIPYGQGKVDAIEQQIGHAPLFVAGSGPGDYEMLTAWSDEALQLIINRNLGCPMSELYGRALDEATADSYLLQGRDESTGEFRSGQETIAYGASQPGSVSNTSCD